MYLGGLSDVNEVQLSKYPHSYHFAFQSNIISEELEWLA